MLGRHCCFMCDVYVCVYNVCVCVCVCLRSLLPDSDACWSQHLLHVWTGFAQATQSWQPPAPREGTETGCGAALIQMEPATASYHNSDSVRPRAKHGLRGLCPQGRRRALMIIMMILLLLLLLIIIIIIIMIMEIMTITLIHSIHHVYVYVYIHIIHIHIIHIHIHIYIYIYAY